MSSFHNFTNKDVRLQVQSFEERRDKTYYSVSVELLPQALKYSVEKRYSEFKDLYDATKESIRGQVLANYDFPSKVFGTDPISRKARLNQLLSVLLDGDNVQLTKELWIFAKISDKLAGLANDQSSRPQSVRGTDTLTGDTSKSTMGISSSNRNSSNLDIMKGSVSTGSGGEITRNSIGSPTNSINDNINDTGSTKSKKPSEWREIGSGSDSTTPRYLEPTKEEWSTAAPDNDAPSCFYEYLLKHFFHLHYYLRLLAIGTVAINQYWSFCDWFYNNTNVEEFYKQYYLTNSCNGMLGSFVIADYINTCANNAQRASDETRNFDLTKVNDRIAISKLGLWTKFAIAFLAIPQALIILLEHLKPYENGKIEPNSTWEQEIITPLFWVLLIFSGYIYLPTLVLDVAAYRNKEFVKYVKNVFVPIFSFVIVIHLFCICAMTFVGTMALQDPNLTINGYWSSGVGSNNLGLYLPITITLYFYSFGAGHVKLDLFGAEKNSDNSSSNDTPVKMSGTVEFGVLVLKRSLIFYFLIVLVNLSMIYTTFDCIRYYFSLTYIGFSYTAFLLAVIIRIRPQSPAHLANILASSGHEYHVFISHAQEPAQDAVAIISKELKARGIKVWRDMEQDELSFDLMKKGIEESMCAIVFVTKNNKKRNGHGHVTTLDKTKTREEEWKYDIKDDERDWDNGYWKNGNYSTEDREKTCSLFRRACAMELSHAKFKGKEVIPIRETRENYGFHKVEDLIGNLPNQFRDIITEKEIMDYQYRGIYEDAFYRNLVLRIEKACKVAKKSDKRKSKDGFDYHVFLVFSHDDQVLADSIMEFFNRKDKDVKYCRIDYSDKEIDIQNKIDKSEKQVIIINDLSSPSDSVQTYLDILAEVKFSEGGERSDIGNDKEKSLNFIFVRDESTIKSNQVDIERGAKNHYFKKNFKEAKFFPTATTATGPGGLIRQSSFFVGQGDKRRSSFLTSC